MNRMKNFCILIAILITFDGRINVFAETRSIYVGDIITIEINPTQFSKDEIMKLFTNFEIIDISLIHGGYTISMRTFDVGEQIIQIGDKEIVIEIRSTLEDIQQEDVFEGAMVVVKSGFLFHWRIIFYIITAIFLLTGGIVLVKFIIKKKTKPESHYQLFLKRSAALTVESENYFVGLTYHFKKYLESLYQRPIIGKTSNEIINELKQIPALDFILHDIGDWLIECDRMKFTGVEVTNDEKHNHYAALLALACNINEGTV